MSYHHAVKHCKQLCDNRQSCTGFFYQQHHNTHQICGFYSVSIEGRKGVWHGHKEGAVCRKIKAPFEEETATTIAECENQCKKKGFCCNDHTIGSNQLLSCAQACVIRIRGTDETTCLSVVKDLKQNRGCSRRVNGKTYHFCQRCNDLNEVECSDSPHGVEEKELAGETGCKIGRTENPAMCCMALTASCLACKVGLTKDEFCARNENKNVDGCERTYPPNYDCDNTVNFIKGIHYSQIVIDSLQSRSVTSFDKALARCSVECNNKEYCTGFFYQMHHNTHQICGFYTTSIKDVEKRWDNHMEGAICRRNVITTTTTTPITTTPITTTTSSVSTYQPSTSTKPPLQCCKAMTASCLACARGISKKKFCRQANNRFINGCEKYAAKKKKKKKTKKKKKKKDKDYTNNEASPIYGENRRNEKEKTEELLKLWKTIGMITIPILAIGTFVSLIACYCRRCRGRSEVTDINMVAVKVPPVVTYTDVIKTDFIQSPTFFNQNRMMNGKIPTAEVVEEDGAEQASEQ
eukprot:g3132.t1